MDYKLYMKLFIIILLAIILIVAGLCLVRISMRVSYYDSLKVDLRIGGVRLDKLLSFVKKKKRPKKEPGAEKKDEKKEKKPILDSLGDIISIVSKFITRFFGHVRVKLAHIVIRVGSDDPASTAVRYGAVIQSVAYLTEILKRKTRFFPQKGAVIDISPDFTADKTVAQIDIKLSVTLGGILYSFISAAIAHLTK
ncbi:MAG: DUF2953 domain-containing protein [Ruminococcaceae bacterium]|nr:DUF2953 domain-containing protein [Oscillospiraceae bacterium]